MTLCLLMSRKPGTNDDAVLGMIDAGRGPVTRDHREDPLVAGQHVHRHDRGSAGLSRGDQRADQGGSDPLALPRVGHNDADLGDYGAAWAGSVRSDPVPDDGAVAGRDQGVDLVPG